MNKLLLTDSELKDIVLRYGSPLYLFYENEFRANFAHLCEAFRAVYKNYIPAYSYKTNYTPYVCGIVKEMGGYAEVVSDMELYLAKKSVITIPEYSIMVPAKVKCWKNIYWQVVFPILTMKMKPNGLSCLHNSIPKHIFG